MMSVYRELNTDELATSELDAHLEQCAACREVFASYSGMGELLRAPETLTPPPEMHEKLMRALADEQLKFLQKSAPGTVATPEFLKPYLKERASSKRRADDIAAFSSAETGPLPILHARRKRPLTRLGVGQMGILGLSAAALILLMLGGLTSLLLLERGNPGSPAISRTSNSVNRPTEVDQKVYTTTTLYPNVTSALPEDNLVYYTASGNGINSTSYMLMQFDRSTQTSKPLLASPTGDPLIVMAVSHSWLVYLQYSRAMPVHSRVPDASDYEPSQRAWKLQYLSLLPTAQNGGDSQDTQSGQPTSLNPTPSGHKKSSGGSQPLINDPELVNMPTTYVLDEDVFDTGTAPGWVSSPIEGAWLVGDTDTLLVTLIDQQGLSHLESYQLGAESTKAILASAPAGHVFAWPTATSTGLQVFWSEEWMDAGGNLQSNIWQQQTTEQALRQHGQLSEVSSSTQEVLEDDGMSFQPQVVNDTLFFLSTSEIRVESQGVVTPNGTPFPTTATDSQVLFTPRTDTGIYPAQPDASVHGTLLMLPLDGPAIGVTTMLGTVGQSTGYQAGSSFVIWQDADGYQMYDVARQSDVVIGDTLNDAALLAVNGSTAFWLSGSAADSRLQLMAFTWPN